MDGGPELERHPEEAGPVAPALEPVGATSHPLLALQRKAGNAAVNSLLADTAGPDPLGGSAVDADVERAISRSPGRPLEDGTLARMEAAFGTDLSGVRVHTGPDADTLSRSLQAEAFTTGPDVFFRQGTYDTASKGGQELLAHELTHVVQQGGGVNRRIDRFVDLKTFRERTYEGRFTQKSTAQKAIEQQLALYAALGQKDAKGKIAIPDNKLAQAIELVESMKEAADLWIQAHTVEVDDPAAQPAAPGQAPAKKTLVDPKRVKRASGMSWFVMAAASELQSLTARRDAKVQGGTAQDQVVVDSKGRQKLKDHYTGNLSGALTKAAWLLEKVVPTEGDSTEFSLDLKIPVYEGVFIGGTLDLSAERDGVVEVAAEAAFQAGGTAGVADIAGALGGYIKAAAKTPQQVMKLVSYSFYRRCVESNAIPREMSSLIWGGGASDYAKAKADQWSRGVESEIFGDGVEGADDAYVESGGLAKVSAEAGIGQAGKVSGEVKGSVGTRYDQKSLKNRKGGAGAENVKSSSFFTQNVADKFGRGAEKGVGRTATNFEAGVEVSFLDGSLKGTGTLSMSVRSQGLHADQRKGLNNVALEELSFEITAAGLLPLGGFAASCATLGLDVASYGRKKYLESLKKAEGKPGLPLSELMLAKTAGETVFHGASGVPFADWAKGAVGLGAKGAAKAGEKALDTASKVGVELAVTLEKGASGFEATIDLKHVKSMSVELPSILEVELLRKQRLGRAKYEGGAWSFSL